MELGVGTVGEGGEGFYFGMLMKMYDTHPHSQVLREVVRGAGVDGCPHGPWQPSPGQIHIQGPQALRERLWSHFKSEAMEITYI